MFGGQNVNAFIFSHSEVSKGQISVKPMRGAFKEKPGFCQGQDAVIKMFNSKLYALDASGLSLHIFDTSLSLWSSSTLAQCKAV